MKDLSFIAGDFLFGDIPPGKEYLLHYFNSDLEKIFLSHYLLLGHIFDIKYDFLPFFNMFKDHTGRVISRRWIKYLVERYHKIEDSLSAAYAKSDIETVAKIKSGSLFKVKKRRQL